MEQNFKRIADSVRLPDGTSGCCLPECTLYLTYPKKF